MVKVRWKKSLGYARAVANADFHACCQNIRLSDLGVLGKRKIHDQCVQLWISGARVWEVRDKELGFRSEVSDNFGCRGDLEL